ncbi:MAG: ABC transporter permease subunit [Micromonosporaceae bacterium]
MTHPGAAAAGAEHERSEAGGPDQTGPGDDRSRVAVTAGGAAAVSAPADGGDSALRGGRLITVLFLAPAMLVLGVLVVYPIFYTLFRSFFDADGDAFIGLENYVSMFTTEDTFTAIKNNVIWVIVAPTVVTALGLVFAVLTERVKWSTAFKVVVFMPMAISFLAAGMTFKMVYDNDPDIGVANAVVIGVHDTFADPAPYPGARSRPPAAKVEGDAVPLVTNADGIQTKDPVAAGEPVLMGLVGVKDGQIPATAKDAATTGAGSGLTGVVWRDFQKGGAGTLGGVDPGEKGLPGVTVEAVQNGKVVGTATTDDEGRFSIPELSGSGYTVRLPAANFAASYGGINWLGPSLATASVIGTYIWIWAGFAMVLIAAGLAAIPRDALEAARVDGATEWQVFRRVTIPLVRPVLVVVFVTLMINVLKIFDLVFVIPPESSQSAANVIALEMWRVAFGAKDLGLGSALGMLLFLVVLPAMLFNVRRFRKEQS